MKTFIKKQLFSNGVPLYLRKTFVLNGLGILFRCALDPSKP